MNRSPIGRALPLACAMLAGACTWAGAPVAEGPPAPVRAASASIVSAPPGPAHPARRVHPASAASAASAAFAAFVAPVASVAPVAAIAPVAPVEPHARERPGGGLRCASATAVLDGDSVVVRTQDGETLQVRIAAIDAPERGQPLADEARAHLAERVLQRALTLRTHERDRYGRTVADLWAGAPLAPLAPAAAPSCAPTDLALDVGLAQIESGYAWHFRRYASKQSPERRRAYEAAERRARAAHTGVWRDSDPTPPWQWRTLTRSARATPPR